ncbi:unnamed protein product [Citrullus colocynthis]|uniref:Sm domain-containing protein n=1 Tax=Citrullus colocynthis TaxID=252529 RepID=A0ABP0Z4I6_9ROSI
MFNSYPSDVSPLSSNDEKLIITIGRQVRLCSAVHHRLLSFSTSGSLMYFISALNSKRSPSEKMEQESGGSMVQEGSNVESNPEILDRVGKVRKLLFRRMLIGIRDGRFFLGNFYCIDKQGNIILQDAVEYRSTRRNSPCPMEQRCLGLILIPNSCRVSCHVDSTIDEQLALLSV